MIDLNVATLTDLCRAIAPQMAERRSGAILNVASTAAFQPGPNMAVYFATKAYVLSFTEALHEELKPHGVKVSCLCPGPTRTEFGAVAGFGGSGLFDRTRDGRSGGRARRTRRARPKPRGGGSGSDQQDRGRERPASLRAPWSARSPVRSNIENRRALCGRYEAGMRAPVRSWNG